MDSVNKNNVYLILYTFFHFLKNDELGESPYSSFSPKVKKHFFFRKMEKAWSNSFELYTVQMRLGDKLLISFKYVYFNKFQNFTTISFI